ncbi:MAG: hypothetical protein LCH95_00610 [Proteobacteria bacterium]|nr:hypothetical protein [Pseudomonadota bacterium]
MPVEWTIDSRERYVTATGEGPVSYDEAVELLDTLAGARALGYRKLLDARQATPSFTPEQLMQLAVKVRGYHEKGIMGALAVVATPEQTMTYARLLGALAAADRPIKVFTTPRAARNWIADQKLPSA